MRQLDDDTYVCARCGGTFIKDWVDEETQEELDDFSPGVTATCTASHVCENCFSELMNGYTH